MTEASARFAIPFILPGQAQKELFHNEAMTRIDTLLHPAVEGISDEPPAAAQPGQCWLTGAGASGAWSGHAHQIAAWTVGGWRFVAPVAGTLVWDKSAGTWRCWNGEGWGDGTLPVAGLSVAGKKVVGERQPAILSPSAGTIIDAEARLAIDRIIVALKSHGLVE